MPRNHRVTIFLNDEEASILDAVREHDLPHGVAARRILMDRAQWLFDNSRKQQPKRGPVSDTDHVRTYSAQNERGTAYDFSSSQE